MPAVSEMVTAFEQDLSMELKGKHEIPRRKKMEEISGWCTRLTKSHEGW